MVPESVFRKADRRKVRFVDTLYLRMLAYPAACLPSWKLEFLTIRLSEIALSPLPAATIKSRPVLMIQKIPNGFR